MSMKLILRDLIAAPKILVAPGVYDAFSAFRAQSAGFESVFLSGSAVAAMHLGRPDIGLLSLIEIAEICGRVTDRVEIPVFVDADQGFGNAHMAARTMQMLERAGAAGIQMEDQHPAKASREPLGRPLVSILEMTDKIKASLDARRDPNLVLSARTDGVSTEGVAAALDRAAAYAEAGADLIFVESLKTRSDMEALVRHLGNKRPLLHNLLRVDDEVRDATTLQQMGYSIALFPAAVPAAVGIAMDDALTALAAHLTLVNDGPQPDRIGAADYLARLKPG